MGSYPGCHYHVCRSSHADRVVGNLLEWVDHLLRVVSVLLWYRSRWGIPHDCHSCDGKCNWLRSGFNQGRSPAPGPQGHFRILDARLGAILQPSHLDRPSPHLSPQRITTILRGFRAVDFPSLLRHPSRWHPLVGLLPLVQDATRIPRAQPRQEEGEGYWI